MAYRDNIAITE